MTAATKYIALNHIATGETYIRDICKKITGGNKYLFDDLHQELFIMIAEMEENKFLQIFNSGSMRYYVIGMAQNQYKSKTSSFYRKYIRPSSTSDEITYKTEPSYEINPIKSEQMDIIDEFLKEKNNNSSFKLPNGNSYDVELFEMYYKDNMSYGEMSIKTGIPKTSCYNTVKNLTKELTDYIFYKYDYYDDTFNLKLKLKNKYKKKDI